MAVPSDGSYGVAPGVIFSFPVTTKNFTYSIVQGLPINEFSQGKLNATSQELFAEKSEALGAWFVYIWKIFSKNKCSIICPFLLFDKENPFLDVYLL